MKYSIKKISTVLGLKDFVCKVDSDISELLIDSRRLTNPAETLFFALETKNNDAHQFLAELYTSGVKNFVVSKKLPQWESLSDANFLFINNPSRASSSRRCWK